MKIQWYCIEYIPNSSYIIRSYGQSFHSCAADTFEGDSNYQNSQVFRNNTTGETHSPEYEHLFDIALFPNINFINSICCRHKRKVQNFLPCKTSPQNNCDGPTGAGVIYEDLHDVLPRSTPTHHHHHHHQYNHPAGGRIAPTIEMIDVKNNIHYPSGYPISQQPPVFLCSSPGPDPYCSQDLYNPVYEELSDAESDLVPPTHSEDEFAEDELSLGGDMDRRRLICYLPLTETARIQ
ncbi:hypothetical protein WA026_007815 [Henosepilachna vigintioctopunctata]|uniref:Uncharacterized protein n=1 Tax=Henosepilachna vigintioctopunctata TaxID=420089 RepID=A0AAW1U428_9CUCU